LTLSNIVTIFLPDFNIVREVFLRQSRILPSSYLQNEPQVRKIRDVIASRVAGKMVELDKQDRETFSSVWADIHTFAKFGMMKDDKFYEKLKDHTFFAVTGLMSGRLCRNTLKTVQRLR